MGLDAYIDEIKARLDIVDVVSTYIPLKRVGRNYVGLCPFHIEKDPSFTVSPDKQIFYCFGCGMGGDAIKFIQLMDGIEFPEAVKKAAEMAGVEIDFSSHAKVEVQEKSRLKQLHSLVAEAYTSFLKADVGKRAREYLKNRGISAVWWEFFKIGYAPSGIDLSQMLLKRGFTRDELERSGLFSYKNGKFYSRFFDRVMIPILDAKGDVVAFGGRIIDRGEPKYLNSPETPIFSKGKILFGLPQARSYIRERQRAIVVEGYMDVISMHVAGFQETVASLGTAFTVDQAKMLSRLTRDVYLLYDGDEAGKKAAFRASKIFYSIGLEAKVVVLPGGMDPDDFIREKGSDSLERLLEEAKPAVDIVLEDFRDGSFSRKVLVDRVLELLEETRDPIVVDSVLGYVSDRINVPFEDLKTAYEARISPKSRRANKEKPLPRREIKWERELLIAFLRDRELWGQWKDRIYPDCFEDPVVKSLIDKLLHYEDVAQFSHELKSGEMALVGKAFFENCKVDVDGVLVLLEKRLKKRELEELKKRISELKERNTGEYKQLVTAYMERLRQIKS
ncbi:DNA primase [Thermosulfidibacter takaii ABI70S6]|uniref:DNA primase n=1 Tax=Thermosulfidibacter takaii (strain DSM 17441 / JCM 13301 / NBRC 103674 / ABI70S6) TaxID=1298851 RepID=A0A0S3QRH9_THET7|nr:DNA primase [Thermosulfidibacter takaii]BAT70946.1 DNA primase [Thermosulfidibacter takaii ABI70S6]